ncbi:A/G-specific adenine glycosylase [Luteolibacter ambystomatis]|uniref:Adenine DNA glycosylase n=1 Tax=Luteolibacter ambystomatis TaxID=2824561 RepID=A0A975G7N5_9BACT|nr:NUDIX domain-containing protein [Luteolibacter ambystomatis]QUE50854.1 A/G-specific adenine glycosylase [Luteolibacter ambystomatis]
MLKPRATRDPLHEPLPFRDALAVWFGQNGRDYPWRRTTDPWAVLVSEVMLQQTQIATVLGRGYYTRFLSLFPDPATLAVAEDEPLLKAWEGLGYYRRARMLRETARAVTAAGGFPDSLDTLQKLPGIGRYTANALRAFAHDRPAAVVDGNVARVLARLLDYHHAVDSPSGLKHLWEVAERLADPHRPRIYNSAIMELGQTFCRPGVPDCLACPVSAFCKTPEPSALPVKTAKPKTERIHTHVLWARDRMGRILLHQEQGKRRQGLWKLPERTPEETADLPEIATRTYGITRFHVTMHIHECADAPAREGESWHPEEAIATLAMPSPYRKAVEALLA